MTELHEDATRAAAQAGTAVVLAELLWTPASDEVVDRIASGELVSYLREYADVLEVDIEDGLANMSADAAAPDLNVRLNVEATFLFRLGDGRSLPAAPFESVWTDANGEMMGKSTIAVNRAYAEAGLQPDDSSGIAVPDHIARELQFLAALRRRQAAALFDGNAQEAERWSNLAEAFKAEHTLAWWPSFFEAIDTAARIPFYRGVAQVGRSLHQVL